MKSHDMLQCGVPGRDPVPDSRRAGVLVTRLALLVVVCLAARSSCTAADPWLFKPTGADGASDYSAPELDDSDWAPVRLPHRSWDDEQPGQYVYGWYRLHFSPPQQFAGRDLVLKLGIIDDVDETYCNGTRVGGTGAFPPNTASAYSTDREYILPSGLVRWGQENVVAVKVFDTIGTGGLLGSPRIGCRAADADRWLFRASGQDLETDCSARELDDGSWESVGMPDETWDQRQPGDGVGGWYRLHFTVPGGWRGLPLVLDLGLVLDADRTYVNGRCIAATGSFPPVPHSAAGEPRLYGVPSDSLRFGADNVLAVQVYNGSARGGIWGRPAFMVADDDMSAATGAPLGEVLRLRRGMHYAAALECLAGLWRRSESDDERAGILDELTVVYGALGRDDAALESFQRLVASSPQKSCSRDAVLAVLRIQEQRHTLSPNAVPLGEDRETRGRWPGAYGNDGFVLSAMGSDADIIGVPGAMQYTDPALEHLSADRPLAYSVSTFAGPDALFCNWIGATATEDNRALANPVAGLHTYSCWDDKGEEHPFDNEGPDLRVTIEIPDGWWCVSTYAVDWDWHGTWHPRQQCLVITDASQAVVAVADFAKFGAGVWHRFALRGPETYDIRIVKGRSICAVLSGLFVDRWQPLLRCPMPAQDPGLEAICGEYGRLASAEAGPPPDSIAPYRNLAESLSRALSTGAPADPVTHAALLLMNWQVAARQAPASTAAQEACDGWCRKALDMRPTGEAPAQLIEELMDRRRFGEARQLTRAYLSHLAPESSPPEELAAAASALCARWLPIDCRFAGEMMDLALDRLSPKADPLRASFVARAVTPFADQLADFETAARGFPRPAFDPTPGRVPSLAGRGLQRLAQVPREAFGPEVQTFLAAHVRALGRGVQAAERLEPRELLASLCASLGTALRLCTDGDAWREAAVPLGRGLELLHDANGLLSLWACPQSDGLPVSERIALGHSLAGVGLDEQAVEAFAGALAGGPELIAVSLCRLHTALANAWLRLGDPARGEEVMLALPARAGDYEGVQRAIPLWTAFQWLSDYHQSSGTPGVALAMSGTVFGALADTQYAAEYRSVVAELTEGCGGGTEAPLPAADPRP